MRRTTILLVNFLVMGSLLTFAEVGARIVKSIQSCTQSHCDFAYLTKLKLYDEPNDVRVGIARYDALLGYAPREMFDQTIDVPENGWLNVKVSVSSDGFRNNGNVPRPAGGAILAAGDSFTFGDQVSDSETWPSCLERTLGREVDNAGVFGYGTAQSLRRALLAINRKKYTSLILSVLVGADFIRDQMAYRLGFPKPVVINIDGRVVWSEVSDPDRPGTKFHPNKLVRMLIPLSIRSILMNYIISRAGVDLSGSRLTLEHPKAADRNEIIRWTLEQLAHADVEQRILLLQYWAGPLSETAEAELSFITATAREMHIKVVDSYHLFAEYDRDQIWQFHHTPLGNRLICEEMARAFK